MTTPYKRIPCRHQPAAGKGEPVLKYLADVCREHESGVGHQPHPEILVMRRSRPKTPGARRRSGRGLRRRTARSTRSPMPSWHRQADGHPAGWHRQRLCNRDGVPKDFRKAWRCCGTSQNVRRVDVMQIGDQYCIQRLYAGIEPEQQYPARRKTSTARWLMR